VRAENIGPNQRLRRMLVGTGALLAGVGLLLVLLNADAPRPWRLLLVVPFWVAELGFFQARERT